jgi:hypothetical protein
MYDTAVMVRKMGTTLAAMVRSTDLAEGRRLRWGRVQRADGAGPRRTEHRLCKEEGGAPISKRPSRRRGPVEGAAADSAAIGARVACRRQKSGSVRAASRGPKNVKTRTRTARHCKHDKHSATPCPAFLVQPCTSFAMRNFPCLISLFVGAAARESYSGKKPFPAPFCVYPAHPAQNAPRLQPLRSF